MDAIRFHRAPTFREYLEGVEANRGLWHAVYRKVRLPEDVVRRVREIPARFRIVALSEDWCGDAVNTLPVVARLADAAGWDMRVLERDENDDLMSTHLTGESSRSIPVVILYDEDFVEHGWWGPRPRELQEWVLGEGASLPPPERYREVRRWYARDRGRSTLKELLELCAVEV